MVTVSVVSLARQTKTIVKKNLRFLLLRNWFSTLLQAAIIPILIIALTLNIKNFGRSAINVPGPPAPIQSLRESLPASSKFLVFATRPGLGADVDDVIQKVTRPLSGVAPQVILHQDPNKLPSQCSATFHGVSNCYAVVEFNDSPLSKVYNGTWNYTIRTDSALSYLSEDIEKIHLPVQLAIENAITDSTTVPTTSWFSSISPEQLEKMRRMQDSVDVGAIYAIVYFLSVLVPVYHVANTITSERASGMSLLIDAMGGSPSGRVLGSMFTFCLLYLPLWIISGALYWYTLFRSSNAAIPIFWQILSGWAITNSTVFAASFFKGTRISGVFIAGSFLALAGGAAILVNRFWIPLDNSRVLPLSLFFPSMNYIFLLFHLTRFAVAELDLDMTTGKVDITKIYGGLVDGVEERYDLGSSVFFVFLVLQIIFYPLLAILAEKLVHGVNFRGREIIPGEEMAFAVDVVGLTKVYAVSWWKKAFCCWRRSSELRALDGLDLVAQKRQILCLLGVNGAGKSTTLDLLSGFMSPTSGTMRISSSRAPLGICPQKNVMRDELTVLEHVNFWSEIKSGSRTEADVEDIVTKCGLDEKRHCRAGKLSGGQKRKLQLACMFVGGSTVCFMDEVTTGLDPLSRRTMWDIILAERAKRSIIFTTHFLDEGDVLADHIVILSKGQIKCQGSGAELKTRFGGGYRVHLPQTDIVDGLDPPTEVHQDRVIYRTGDSRSAARLVTQLEAAGHKKVQMSGPTIEDVFLNVTREDLPSDTKETSLEPSNDYAGKQLSTGHRTSFWTQVRVLLRKRLTILPRYWISTLLALVLPIVCVPAINTYVTKYFERTGCKPIQLLGDYSNELKFYTYSLSSSNGGAAAMPVGPRSANQSLFTVLRDYPIGVDAFNISEYNQQISIVDDLATFQQYISVHGVSYQGGLYMGDEEAAPLLASFGGLSSSTQVLLNLWSQVQSKVPIAVMQGTMNSYLYSGNGADSWIYVIYACFILAIYPSFFSLYPAFEKTRQIRALQYSNGVRPLPMWTAYFLFDFCFVLVVSICFSMTIHSQFSGIWWQPLYMLPLCILYGITGILISYIISLKAPSQLAAFLWTIGYMVVAFLALGIYSINDMEHVQRTIDIVSFSLNLIFPIGNMFRAMGIGLNIYRLACRNDDDVTDPNSIWAYGLPILYLCLQVIVLPFILIWADNDLSISPAVIRRLLTRNRHPKSDTKPAPTTSPLDKEPSREQTTHTDLLQLSHVTKSFTSTATPAVNDVSLSLSQGEILALLGPNGAGKTTIVNLIRGILAPSSGQILIRGSPDPTTHAQRSLGVCPQFDALDLLTARQHLEFYARIKGVADPVAQADLLMAKVDLSQHASRLARHLSGGNRRKLSLAIALTGNPDVLVLDEPSSAMDAAAKRLMWQVLADIAPGRSLLLTTHSMEEADALATRAAILSRGRLLAVGTTQVLRERYADLYHVHLVLASAPGSSEGEMEGVEEWVRGQFGDVVFEGQSLGGQVKFMVPNGAAAAGRERGAGMGRVVEVLEEKRGEIGLADYSIGAPTLERVFLSVVKDVVAVEEDVRPRRRKFFGRFGRGGG
ncbi:P-loop containing nucleoside triphosphate hydrolase protein [Coniochaeta ligniaria NRRL 30616]|uniref:p-loop containing nucleoside triphosphate hydrolase protein n=1 Tax=Coniochaeta ligniaria NRRL 30616 TaxID=1408157 RepID=A0A1J7K4S8_9PEZI|nr:P-loop containing nucleoside triphosphate hydrolase protein [Coniochaeta ligniaria NRRL 30616]